MEITFKWPDGVPLNYNHEAMQGMLDRMAVSYYKYGDFMKIKPGAYDYKKSYEKRIEIYDETGNTEGLLDAANFIIIEHGVPQHPNAHFRATDSDESPGWATYGGRMTTKSRLEEEADEAVNDFLRRHPRKEPSDIAAQIDSTARTEHLPYNPPRLGKSGSDQSL